MKLLRVLVAAFVLVFGTWLTAAPAGEQPRAAGTDAAKEYSGSQPAKAPLEALLDGLAFRNIGVFRTGAWVTDIAVPEFPARDHLYTIYAATRSGGLWKTTNAGTTWTPISDSAGVAAVGAVALAPSQPSTVWMGTGDQANTRSSYSGKGVFKSTDAGATWQLMGLTDSHHIARIVIHPKKPDVVYVAAMGHLFSRNDERGVFRTLDGGKTWKKVLFVNDGVGAIDLVINRSMPSTLYAAMYDKERRPWQIVESGPESGIYRTDDGGETWRRLSGGLPTGKIGRIGIDIYQKKPSILYALIENQNTPPTAAGGLTKTPAPGAGGQRGQGPLATNIIGNELYRTDDGGKTWRKATDVNVAGGKAPYSFNQIRIDPNDDRTVIVNSDSMFVSRDSGKTWDSNFFRGMFGDFRAMWWDPEDSMRLILGSDGGVSVSVDGGRTSDYFPNMRIGEVYAVGVDMEDPYNVYGGLQDHDSWKGPSNGPTGRITLENWVTVGPGDGMYNVVDPTDSRWVYNTREMNQMGRMDQRTGIRTPIAPTRPPGQPRLRFNWIAPIALSPHNPQILYAGAQVLFRSLDRGDHWQEISPDLTTNDPAKIGLNVPYCTITSISESPLVAGVIWVGTDDGKTWLTKDHGGRWIDRTNAVAAAGGPPERWVSRVFASPHEPGTAYVAKNGFRNDDFEPYLYRTSDFGETWTSIGAGLPRSPINVVVQDRKNPNLLVIGNDVGVFMSVDAGTHWTRLAALPPVAVHDLTIHPRENDLVVGTYGRGFWVGDISPLQDLPADVFSKPIHLFDIEPRTRYGFSTQGMNYHLFGSKYIQVPNEPDAMAINYWLRDEAREPVRITITDVEGRTIARLSGPGQRGFNRALWNMQATLPQETDSSARQGGERGRGGPPVPVGTYLVKLEAGGVTTSKVGRVRERIR
ncbi:MAG: WD40/YVTN/BNR-like repeat-containing protein [Vicinamibacterales bacterium]